jgi:hypothetical protein
MGVVERVLASLRDALLIIVLVILLIFGAIVFKNLGQVGSRLPVTPAPASTCTPQPFPDPDAAPVC